MAVAFRKIASKMRFMNPQKDFALEEIPFEIRTDPLTGFTGRVFDLPYSPPEHEPIEGLGGKPGFCPFCPEHIEQSTPLYPKELISEGRIRIGEATLFPNLLPLDKYTGVSVLSHDHYIAMQDMTPDKMTDAFFAARLLIERIAETDPEVACFNINWNYGREAGSSIVHPHLQVNCGEIPTNLLRLQLEGCKRYREENGTSFWEDFIAEERDGERYVGEIRSTFWAMSYVSTSVLPEVWCIFPERQSLVRMDEESILAFANGLSRIIQYFHSENIPAFNVSMFAVREDGDFRVNARILPRLLTRPIGNSDQTYYHTAHKETYSLRPPEKVCRTVRSFFN